MADVIEAFVRHHCAFVERMIIVDNGSRDNTLEILSALKKEGISLEIRRDEAVFHRQSEALTEIIDELRLQNPPDWILPLDADEFLVGDPLSEIFDTLPTSVIPLVPWRSYVPTPKDTTAEPCVLRRIRHRKSLEKPQWYKIAIPKEALAKRVLLPQGSHSLLHADTGKDFPYRISPHLALAHFPVRSAEQICSKVFHAWPRLCAYPLRSPGIGFQWEALYESFASGGSCDASQLRDIAMKYATAEQWASAMQKYKDPPPLSSFTSTDQASRSPTEENALLEDPVPCNFTLRYIPAPLTALRTLAMTAEELALEIARVKKSNFKQVQGCGLLESPISASPEKEACAFGKNQAASTRQLPDLPA